MRGLCTAPQSPASMSPAVGVADGFPYPLGGGGVAKAKRPIDCVCHTRGQRNKYLTLDSHQFCKLYVCAGVENSDKKKPDTVAICDRIP